MWKDSLKEFLCEEALKSSRVRSSRHAACIVHRGSVLAVGHNQYKTHPEMKRWSRSDHKICLHAEIDAILRCIKEHGVEILAKSELYVLRLNKSGKIASSKPCATCSRAIQAFRLTPYWTDNEVSE